MSIDKIGSVDATFHIDHRSMPKRQHPLPEKTDSVSAGKTDAQKNSAKIKDPPFFPIGDTQSIFNK